MVESYGASENIIQSSSLVFRANSTATGANYRVSKIKQINSEGNSKEM
jgi:hypothetical protein